MAEWLPNPDLDAGRGIQGVGEPRVGDRATDEEPNQVESGGGGQPAVVECHLCRIPEYGKARHRDDSRRCERAEIRPIPPNPAAEQFAYPNTKW
jgi:hypothetical protein